MLVTYLPLYKCSEWFFEAWRIFSLRLPICMKQYVKACGTCLDGMIVLTMYPCWEYENTLKNVLQFIQLVLYRASCGQLRLTQFGLVSMVHSVKVVWGCMDPFNNVLADKTLKPSVQHIHDQSLCTFISS